MFSQSDVQDGTHGSSILATLAEQDVMQALGDVARIGLVEGYGVSDCRGTTGTSGRA